jgi:type IV pilus assembly protein PilF
MKASLIIVVLGLCFLSAACVTTTNGPEPASAEEAAVANMNLGIGYLRQGRPEIAVDALERAISLNPRLAPAHSALAIAYDQLSEPEEAEEHHRRATQLAPDNSDVQNSYAVFLCRHDRWADAELYFERALSNPRYATPTVARVNAGNCAREADDLAKAEDNYRAALTLDPRNADALDGMIELSVLQENYLQARAFIQRSFAAHKATARELALCYYAEQQLDDRDAADECLRELRASYPDSPELGRILGSERDAGS